MPFQGRKLHTLLSSRHGIKAAAEGRPCYLASWSCRGRGCLPCPASCQASPAPSLCPLPPHAWIFQAFVLNKGSSAEFVLNTGSSAGFYLSDL